MAWAIQSLTLVTWQNLTSQWMSGQTRADDIGGIAEAGELLAATDTGVAEGFAEFVAPHAFSAGAFRAGVHW
jgi:hypothetical protein